MGKPPVDAAVCLLVYFASHKNRDALMLSLTTRTCSSSQSCQFLQPQKKNERDSNEFERWLNKPKGNQNHLRGNPRTTDKESNNKLRDALNILLQLEIKISLPQKKIEHRTLVAWATSSLPLSYNHQTATSPFNPLYMYVLHSWVVVKWGNRKFNNRPTTVGRTQELKIELKENLTSSASLVLGNWNAIL